jgi:PAS domain S-box-containing protein
MKAQLSARTIRYHGEPHVLSVLNDVSDLMAAKNALQMKNEELHEERDRLQRIADQSPGVVYQMLLKDDNPKFIFVSKGAEVFIDVPTEMWLSSASWLFDRILTEDRQSFLEAMRASAQAGTMCRHEFRLMDNDGSIRWILNTSSASQERDGGTVWTGTMIDITERKRSEEAVIQVNRQLTLMTSMTRHDCLNKIVATEGYIDLATRMAGDEKMIDLLDKAQGSIEAIRSEIDLTRELQEISSNEARWLRMRDIVQELMTVRSIRVSDPIRHLEVFSSPMLRQVFMNLLDNSIRHGVHVTEAWIECDETDDGLISPSR